MALIPIDYPLDNLEAVPLKVLITPSLRWPINNQPLITTTILIWEEWAVWVCRWVVCLILGCKPLCRWLGITQLKLAWFHQL